MEGSEQEERGMRGGECMRQGQVERFTMKGEVESRSQGVRECAPSSESYETRLPSIVEGPTLGQQPGIELL
jgi:uncharacterized Zn finger protein